MICHSQICVHTVQNVTSSKEQTNKKKHITKQKDQITNFRSSEIRMTSAEEVEHQRRAKKKKKSYVHSSSELCCPLGVNLL